MSSPPGVQVPPAPEKLRVLCIDYSIGFGGATKSMSLMLRDMDHVDPVIVTSQVDDVRKLWYGQWRTYRFRRIVNYRSRWIVGRWLRRLHAPRFLHFVVQNTISFADSIAVRFNTLRLRWLLRKHRIEILHLANGFLPIEAIATARAVSIPVLIHMRGFFTPTTEAALRRIDVATHVGTASEAVRRSFIETSDRAVPSTTLHEVVDVAEIAAAAGERDRLRAGWGLRHVDVAVGLFGRVIPWKGQKEFTRAMIRAMDEEPRLVAFIVGDVADGTDGYFDEVKELIRSSGKADRFHLTGYVEAVEPLFSAMDIIVHASIDPEPCGLVILEGMAARRPVIAADAGGPQELVTEGEDGRLVKPGDVSALAAAIVELAADPEKRRQMGEAGYRRVKERHDVAIAARRLQDLYERLAAGTVTGDVGTHTASGFKS